jgi:hypothetical protein
MYLELSTNLRDWDQECVIESTDGNPLKYNPLYVLDNDLKTAVNFYTNYLDKIYFQIKFNKEYPVDKIVIYNGYQKSDDLFYKNQRIKIFSYSGFIYYREPEYIFKDIISSAIFLKDNKLPQEIIFSNSIYCNLWGFGADSTYPGTKYNDIAVSEIEFWYKGQKYEIANLHQVMMAYSNYVVENRVGGLPKYPVSLFTWGNSEENDKIIIDTFNNLGYNHEEYSKIELRKKDYNIYIYQDGTLFKEDKPYLKNIQYKNGIKIGQWKTDKWGVLWIKVGKGKWKSTLDYSKFTGTDLENGGWDYCYNDYPIH